MLISKYVNHVLRLTQFRYVDMYITLSYPYYDCLMLTYVIHNRAELVIMLLRSNSNLT